MSSAPRWPCATAITILPLPLGERLALGVGAEAGFSAKPGRKKIPEELECRRRSLSAAGYLLLRRAPNRAARPNPSTGRVDGSGTIRAAAGATPELRPPRITQPTASDKKTIFLTTVLPSGQKFYLLLRRAALNVANPSPSNGKVDGSGTAFACAGATPEPRPPNITQLIASAKKTSFPMITSLQAQTCYLSLRSEALSAAKPSPSNGRVEGSGTCGIACAGVTPAPNPPRSTQPKAAAKKIAVLMIDPPFPWNPATTGMTRATLQNRAITTVYYAAMRREALQVYANPTPNFAGNGTRLIDTH